MSSIPSRQRKKYLAEHNKIKKLFSRNSTRPFSLNKKKNTKEDPRFPTMSLFTLQIAQRYLGYTPNSIKLGYTKGCVLHDTG